MKLKVYQQGGGLIYTPFIPGAQGTPQGSGKSSGEDDSKIDPLDKEILALMKDQNLLPSDIQMIFNRLTSFQKRTQHLTGLGAGAYRSVMPGMLQIQHMISLAKNNKENWDKSVEAMKSHDAGSEIALDSYGNMWVRDISDGGLKRVKPSEYNKAKHEPVSYSQLMFFRRSEPDMAFSTIPFEEMGEHIVGMKDARNEIEAVISKFGTIKAETFEMNEFKDLAKEVKDKGYFKVSTEHTRSLDDLNRFASIVWANLGTNIQHMLTARAVDAGYKDPILFLREMVFANSKESYEKSFDASMSKAANGADDTGSKTLKEDTYQIRFANGDGNDIDVALVPKASKISDKAGLFVKGKDFGPMLNFKELPLEPMNLQRLLFTGGESASALATSVRSTDVTFGNKLLDETELPAIMYGADSLTSKVYLPYRNQNGHFVPDFEVIQNFNKYVKARKNNPNMSITEKNALLQECKLKSNDIIENKDGTFSLKNVMPFLTFSAYAGDDTIKFTDTEKEYLAKVDRSKGRLIADMYNNSVKYDNAYAKKDAAVIRKKYGKSEAGDFWEGLVFIPVPDAFYAYNSTSNQYLPPQEFNNISARIQANNVENELRSQAQADPNYSKYSTIGQWYE